MRLLPSVLATVAVTGTALATAGQASAADPAYQYWGYFQVTDGAFVYATKGAGEFVPKDGSIEGHRWAASPMGQTNAPRADLATLTFDAVCGDDTAKAGEKRVAVVVDFGPQADAIGDDKAPAPYADCAVVPADATGLQTLQAVADVRTAETSMGTSLCAIDGYPSTTCADGTTTTPSAPDEVTEIAVRTDKADAASAEKDDSDTGLLVGGGVVVVLLLLLGGVIARRRTA